MTALSSVPAASGTYRETTARVAPGGPSTLPDHADVVADLKRLRARGLLRIRGLALPALATIACLLGYQDPEPRTLERVLRQAADQLGTDEFGMSARYLFGLVQGTFGRKPTDLRERAATELGLAAETFRKDRERLIVDRVADELLTLAVEAAEKASGTGARPVFASAPEPHRGPPDLPRAVVHFTGREAEIDQAAALLLAPNGVCAVHGLAGSGKSALAIELGDRLGSQFPDGVIVLGLATHTPGAQAQTARDVLVRLLMRLGVMAEVVPEHIDNVAVLLARALSRRRALVILDDVADAAQVMPLLDAVGSSAVLITSRTRLTALDTSGHLHLKVLARNASRTLFARVAGLTDADTSQLGQLDGIAHLCGDLPLALRVLAARHRLDPFPDLSDLLASLCEERDRLLELDDGTRAVTASFELSLRGLSAIQRQALLLIAQAPGADLPQDAAGPLLGCPPPEARRLLADLEAANLLERRAPRRYGLHDLVAAFARSRGPEELPPADRDASLGRLADWYLHSLDAADRWLAPARFRFPVVAAPGPTPAFGTYRQALDWADQELANLVALTQESGRRGLDAHCWQLAYLLKSYLYLTKDWNAWRRSHEPALDATRRLADRRAEAMTLNNLGLAALESGDRQAAEEHYRGAHYLFGLVHDIHGVHTALANMSWVWYADGDYQRFVTDLTTAYRFYLAEGMERNAAINRRGLGLGELRRGHPSEAIEHSREALDFFRTLAGAELDAVMAQVNLAEAETADGRRRPGRMPSKRSRRPAPAAVPSRRPAR